MVFYYKVSAIKYKNAQEVKKNYKPARERERQNECKQADLRAIVVSSMAGSEMSVTADVLQAMFLDVSFRNSLSLALALVLSLY